MRYSAFEITNFKGIKHLKFKLDAKPLSNMITLVGLNESGKTTILEAMSYWYESISRAEESLHSTEIGDANELVPRSMQFNFNDNISIQATLVMEDEDVQEFNKWASKYGYTIDSRNVGFKPPALAGEVSAPRL